MNKPTVSILTISQLSRIDCLKILFECIKKQTYENIKEWVIVDGSKSFDEGMCNQILVNELINSATNINFQIKYIPYKDQVTLGELKNRANQNASCDYIIWMDDDDYQIPGRVEYSLNKLLYSKKLVGGNINMFMFDVILGKCYKTSVPLEGSVVIIPNSLIYSKEFLKNHTYDNNNNVFEEISFLNNAIDQFEILIPETTFVKIIHNSNTNIRYKKITLSAAMGSVSHIEKLEDGIRRFLIPDYFNEKYKDVFIENDTYINYDIVYYTGGHGIQWDPTDHKLGGSEQAVVHLSENWVKLGKNIIVYGNFDKDKLYNGVTYQLWDKYPFNKKAKNLIVWRTPGILPLMDIDFKADNVIVDFHDNFSYTLAHLDKRKLFNFFEKINKFNFKSQYHKDSFEEFIGNKLDESKYNIILNGLRLNEFRNKDENLIRNPYRFCYCSSYDRGLEHILENVWSHIYAKEPKAEFHIYYGMEHLYDQAFKQKLTNLMNQPGVFDHGRQPMEEIIKEKYLSTFHLYLNTSVAEIDCISIRESLVTGCIPIISSFGVFATRHGIQYTWEPTNKELCKIVADDIINKMYDNEFIVNARQQLLGSNTIVDWSDIAKIWLQKL
jgi:glycosyltransferase involved in cell wall biosynthesis